MSWRKFGGGISDKATKKLIEDLTEFEYALDGVNKSETDVLKAISSLKSWAKVGLGVLKMVEPILEQYIVERKASIIKKEEKDKTETEKITINTKEGDKK